MTDYPQRVGNSLNERMRLNRLRRRKEDLSFWSEFRLVPTWLKVVLFLLFLVAQAIAFTINMEQARQGNIFPPDFHDNPALASLALAALVTMVSIFVAGFICLIAYVNRDAKRRGMNSFLWTVIVLIFLPTWGLIGFIIYLLLREPLPYPCPQCAATVGARFNFCPNCKCNLHPACPQCKNEVGELDKFCPYCGNDLSSTATHVVAGQTELNQPG
jgi:double zinc ribbon protein